MTMRKLMIFSFLILLLSCGMILGNACDDDDDDDDDDATDDDVDDDDVDDDDVDDDDVDDDATDDDAVDDDMTDDDDDEEFVDNGDGTASDGASGLMWQVEPGESTMTQDAAVAYCDNLSLAGHDDWRLPSLDDYRSLIRGCAATMTGGECPTDDQCLNWDCWDSVCTECSGNGGPDEGCYWPVPLSGTCGEYWTSIILDGGNSAWLVWFHNAGIYSAVTWETGYARCVR